MSNYLAEAARSAAEIMSRKGQCKGTLEDGEGKVCFMGALMLALSGKESLYDADAARWRFAGSPWNTMTPEDRVTLRAVDDAASGVLEGRGRFLSPVDYNNSGETTGEDVILLLKETAEALESAC